MTLKNELEAAKEHQEFMGEEHPTAGTDFLYGVDFAIKSVIEMLEERKSLWEKEREPECYGECQEIINLLKSEA